MTSPTPSTSNPMFSPFGVINRKLVDSTLVETTLNNATKTIRESISRSTHQPVNTFNDWSNTELSDFINGTSQTSYYQSDNQVTGATTSGEIDELKRVCEHPIEQIGLPHQLSSLHTRTLSSSIKQSASLVLKQTINKPKTYEETKEQSFETLHKPAGLPFAKSMFYDESSHNPPNQQSNDQLTNAKRNPRVDYMNVNHAQRIHHTIKNRTQREHNSLMNQMLDAAQVGATEQIRLKEHKTGD